MSEAFSCEKNGFKLDFLSGGKGSAGIRTVVRLSYHDEEFTLDASSEWGEASNIRKIKLDRVKDLVAVMKEFVANYEKDFGPVAYN